MIELSIVILSYNVRDLLLGCLKSIYEHTHGLEFETIVVDNASPDDSVERVREQFPRVIVVAHPNNDGFSRGNNVGLAMARGQAVILLNSDTVIQSNVFKELYDALMSDPRLGAVGPRLVYPDGRVQHFCARENQNIWQTLRIYYLPQLKEPRLFLKDPLSYPGLFETEGISGAAMMVRQEVLEKVGGLDEGFWAYCEDTDWSKRIALSGFKLACLTTVEILHYHGRGLSQNERRRRVEAIKSEIRYFRKYGQPLERVIYRAGVILNTLLRMLTIDLARLATGKNERFVIDGVMLRCLLQYRISDEEARTRESVSQAKKNARPAVLDS